MKIVFQNVHIVENERGKMYNVKFVFENVQIAKNECENMRNLKIVFESEQIVENECELGPTVNMKNRTLFFCFKVVF